MPSLAPLHVAVGGTFARSAVPFVTVCSSMLDAFHWADGEFQFEIVDITNPLEGLAVRRGRLTIDKCFQGFVDSGFVKLTPR